MGKRSLKTSSPSMEAAPGTKLTPAAVSEILRKEEFSSGDLYPEGTASVRYFETNTLASNRPLEDSHSEAILHPSKPNDPPGMLFGVYDGHGGASCGIVTANRLQHYVTAGLLPTDDLKNHLDQLKQAGEDVDAVQKEMNSILTGFNDDWEMVHDLKRAHQRSYIEYISNLFRERVEEAESESGLAVAEKISRAFIALDQDMSDEAIAYAGDDEVGLMTSTVALSGAVAVIAQKLSPKDKFLVIGSDGLWDMMTPMQVIRLVGVHMQGKITLSPLVLNESVDVKFSDLFRVLKQRQSAMKLKPQDLNSATHLVRSALGGTAYGVDHGRLSQMLTLPPDMVRMFRDDITVTVIFFDQEFLRHS